MVPSCGVTTRPGSCVRVDARRDYGLEVLRRAGAIGKSIAKLRKLPARPRSLRRRRSLRRHQAYGLLHLSRGEIKKRLTRAQIARRGRERPLP